MFGIGRKEHKYHVLCTLCQEKPPYETEEWVKVWEDEENGDISIERFAVWSSSISQQIMRDGKDGKWTCSSHFASPDGEFDTMEEAAMAAYDAIENPFYDPNPVPHWTERWWKFMLRLRFRFPVYAREENRYD